MRCQELAAKIEHLSPGSSPGDVARLCLLLSNLEPQLDRLCDDARLEAAWHRASLRLQSACDQHTAMSAELESLAESPAGSFSAEHISVLLRAIKVQSQVLQLYVGDLTGHPK